MRERPPLQERVGPTRQETTDRIKKELQYLGVDISTIPDNKVEDFYSNHFQWAEPKNTEKELVFADIEYTIDDSRTFTPNLICFERETSEEKYHFWCKSCIREFINQLKAWIKPTRGRLQLHSFFHNFRGFDGLFNIKKLYDMNLKVSKVLTTGQKILYFECGNLKFKDSMSFLNMPLEKFSDTFKLSELKKGYFPHEFNTAENENCEGKIQDLKFYETHCMTTKKKEAVEKWHAEEVLKGEASWNFKKELLEYRESDVKLLKEGCLTFARDFEKECGFNPLKENITIASACHNFWRNNQMIPYSIAVEPPHGWTGLKTCQSKIGFQWLFYQDNRLRGNRIKHVSNGGEKVIMLETYVWKSQSGWLRPNQENSLRVSRLRIPWM